MKRINFKNVFVLFCFSLFLQTSVKAQMFEYRSHTNGSIAKYSMPYRLFVPSNYNPGNSYPLVLFLHGAGERGTDNNAQLTANRGATIWAELETQASHPCFVVAPQCPEGKQWVNTSWVQGSYSIDNILVSNELKMVKDIINTLQTQYSIDASRLYITGLSMGGYGTWDFILRYPSMFKAAIPMCGAGDPTKASLIGSMPVWTFHSNDDAAVPVSGSRDMVNAINALGFNNRTQLYSEYYNHGHVLAYQVALEEPNLVDWLFNAEPVDIITELVDVTKLAGTSSAQGGKASNAFDDAIYTKWLDFANDYSSTRSSWVQYHFPGNSYIVTHYSITSANDFPQRDPKNWDILGSDNGSEWTVLDTRTNELFDNRFQKNTYSFANKTAYSYYRLQINSVFKPNEANCVQLSEFTLWAGKEGSVAAIGVTESSASASISVDGTQKLTVANIQPNTVVRVVSMNGCVVSEVLAKSETVEFDVSHWKKGVYLFYLQTAKNVLVRKAIIQ